MKSFPGTNASHIFDLMRHCSADRLRQQRQIRKQRKGQYLLRVVFDGAQAPLTKMMRAAATGA